MASNFHNILGFLAVGCDFHKGLQIATGVPIPDFPFWEIVALHPFIMGPNQKPKVKINGVSSVVDGHTPLLLWPHFPIPSFNAFMPLDVLFGTQSCWLPRGTVYICDEVSTCAVYECVSVNLDCWEWTKIPSDLVLQFGTVKTTPSPGDFLFGVIRAVINAAVDVALYGAFKKLDAKFDKGLGKKLLNPGEHLATEASQKGLGYQMAKKLGSVFTQHFDEGLTKRAAGGFAKSVGRRIAGEFLQRLGMSPEEGIVKKGLDAAGFEPSRMVPKSWGNPEQAAGPFKGWGGAGDFADKQVPMYGAAHGVIQGLGG
jgi:hypothetical protein